MVILEGELKEYRCGIGLDLKNMANHTYTAEIATDPPDPDLFKIELSKK